MNTFYITCISNASTPEFPENSLTKFTNILPKNIDTTSWHVAIQSISFENKFEENYFPSFIKVRLHEIEYCLSTYSRQADLAVIPYINNNQSIYYFEFDQKQYFKIRAD